MAQWFDDLCRSRVQTQIVGASKVEKSHRMRCDINTIVNKYRKTGLSPQRADKGFYGDFSNVTDYQTSLEQIRIAEAGFMELPAAVRKQFRNDPARLLAFLENPDNYDKAVELGILPKTSYVQSEDVTEENTTDSEPSEPAASS